MQKKQNKKKPTYLILGVLIPEIASAYRLSLFEYKNPQT